MRHARTCHPIRNAGSHTRPLVTRCIDGSIAPPGQLTPPVADGREHVYHLYVIRTSDREGMMKHLKEAGIGSAIHYPVPLHLQRAYVSLNYGAGDFPVTESAASEIVSLPMYPQLKLAQLEKVAAEVMAFAAASGSLLPAVPIA